jgi:PIF1-like helicase/Helitron helicase-like domain at N-terminus/Helicase
MPRRRRSVDDDPRPRGRPRIRRSVDDPTPRHRGRPRNPPIPRPRQRPRERYNLRTYKGIGARYDLDTFFDHVTHESVNVVVDPNSPHYCRQVLPGMDITCQHCNAALFKGETPKICCGVDGKNSQLESYPPAPPPIFQLWLNNMAYRLKTRPLNQSLSFGSIGADIDENLANQRDGVYTFRIRGQMSHRIGSAQAIEGERPKFAQIYFYERNEQLGHRLHWFNGLDEPTLAIIQQVIHEQHRYVHVYEQARNLQLAPDQDLNIVFHASNTGRHNEPHANEVGAILIDGAINQFETSHRDVVLRKQGGYLERIDEFSKMYDPLLYPLFFPQGTFGWHFDFRNPQTNEPVTLRDYTTFHLMVRDIKNNPQNNPLHLGGRLFQQWVVDQYCKIETNNLNWIRTQQTTLRADSYANVRTALNNGEEWVGKRIILPATFPGSPRDMKQQCKDSMAIVRQYTKADLFITMTTNPRWPEIEKELLAGQTASDRPDVVARVFNDKLKEVIDDIWNRHCLGPAEAYCYTIEFQKRGLPHAHILHWLKPEAKPRTTADIDKLVSAEIPDPATQPVLYKTVSKHMMHGPCGHLNPNCPCSNNRDQQCTKDYPKPLREETDFNEKGFPFYRRRQPPPGQVPRTVRKGQHELDNSWVVPYNVYLSQKYDCHINVEVCSSIQSVKYMHKYIYKGHDRASIRIVEGEEVLDETQSYVDGRYVGPVEACWKIFGYPMHGRSHTIVRLPIHLPDQQSVVFRDNQNIQNIQPPDSMLLAYFYVCGIDPEASMYTYLDFPFHYSWDPKQKMWYKRQKKHYTIGRLHSVSVTDGERFFLRMLLTRVTGAKSFEDVRTFEGVVHHSFREACIARGMLDDDTIWIQALEEAQAEATAFEMRLLFVSILLFSQPSDPLLLWERFYQGLSEDFAHHYDTATPEELFAHTANSIDYMLREEGRSWSHYPTLPDIPNVQRLGDATDNTLIEIQKSLKRKIGNYQANIHKFNDEQQITFQTIIQAIEDPNHASHFLFFLEGSGGSGKTFLCKTLLDYLRDKNHIALSVASSGIASLLLPGGTTAHSRFKIPLNPDEAATCNISHNTQLYHLLQETSLIVWDEAPMMHRYAFEALDRTLRDLFIDTLPMGGKVCVFCGDWKQILPVVPSGTPQQTINACLKKSTLWQHVHHLQLTNNMRVLPNEVDFASWLLQVGRGTHNDYPHLTIPPEMRMEGTISDLIDKVYPNLQQHLGNAEYLRDRVILATTNKIVNEINETISKRLGQGRVYKSIDSLADSATDNDVNMYPIEFLNSIEINGLPPHRLSLSVGCVIMLIRNLNKAAGLCNGTRLIVTALHNNSIQANILTGDFVGTKVYIPRIKLTPTDTDLPFTLSRLQFPVKLAFAMTINKSQGQTFSQVGICLLQRVFTHGQLYVAISRVTSPEHLTILLPDGKTYVFNAVFKPIFG